MKKDFDFKLSGGRLFPVFVAMLATTISFLAAYFIYMVRLEKMSPLAANQAQTTTAGVVILSACLLLIFIMGVLSFFYYKLLISHTEFDSKFVKTDYSFGKYIWLLTYGTFLTIVTIGIYGAWFDAKLRRFFIDNASHDDYQMRFNGKGSTLFMIMLICLIAPIFILVFTMAMSHELLLNSMGPGMISFLVLFYIIYIILICIFQYLYYRWLINITYKDCAFILTGDTFKGAMFILGQIMLSIITMGIYSPAAILKIYRYLASRTAGVASDGTVVAQVGTDISVARDFWYVLLQYFLTGITCYIYAPWAISKVYQRILSQTYIEFYQQKEAQVPAQADHSNYLPQ